MYLLWKNVYLGPLLIVNCLFGVELYGFLGYFGHQAPSRYVVWKYLLRFNRLPFHFGGSFLRCAKACQFAQSHLFVLLLFPLPEEIYPKQFHEDQFSVLLMVSSRGFMASVFLNIFWVHFHIRCGKVVQSDSLAWKLSSFFPTPFIDKAIFFPLFVSSFLSCGLIYMWVYFIGFSVLFHWPLCLFLCQYHIVLVTRVLQYSLKSTDHDTS